MGVTDRKKARRRTAYSLATSVVRLTHEVKAHIISKAKWGESIDQTLRRIFKLGEWKGRENGEEAAHAP